MHGVKYIFFLTYLDFKLENLHRIETEQGVWSHVHMF